MKLGIFTAFRNQHKYYIRSCEELGIDYEVIDIIASDWYEKVVNSDCDGFLCRPPSKFQEWKMMFDERLYVVNKLLNLPIYPTYEELYIYENKRMMSYWLDFHKFPHVRTQIFYRKKDYFDFLDKNNKYPIVSKLNTGSTGKGVKIIKSKLQAKQIGHLAFGVFNNKLAIGYSPQKTGKIIGFPAIGTIQKHHLIIQEFVKIKWEWRMIKIGNSYFGHKKLLKGDFASGSKKKGWTNPPVELLHLIKNICDAGNFLSMNADIFETEDGKYYINELQSIFGQSTKNLMYVNGKEGRYVYVNGKFEFEEGEFNQHQSFLLRVKHFISILQNNAIRKAF